MEERTVELTIISATNLKKVVKFGKQTCYAVAYIDPKQTKKTKKDGGTDPSWNQKLTLICDEQRLRAGGMVVIVEVYSDGTFSDKLIGTVTIPISDIAKEVIGKEVKEDKGGEEEEGKVKEKSQEAQYLAFEVRRPSGKAKGVLNIAVKLGEKRTIQVYQNQPPPQAYGAYHQRNGQSSSDPQVPYQAGYPAPPPGYPNQYPPQPYGVPPPQYANQYPPQQGAYYPQQPAPYYQPPPYYQQQPPRRGGGGGIGLGLGAGLLGGAIGGLLVADMVDDIGDDCGDF